MNTVQVLRPQQNRRRSISTSLYEPKASSIKSLLFFDNNKIDSLSPYDKLALWKQAMEKALNSIYLTKIREIDNLLSQNQNQIDVKFDKIPSFEQSIIITNQEKEMDHTYDDIELDYSNAQSFNLSSNNLLLATSNDCTLTYDNIRFNLMIHNNQAKLNSYPWDVNEYGEPYDLTYSYYLNVYCIITNRGLFTWSLENPDLPLYIDPIKPIGRNRLWTVATTDNRSDVFILFQLGSYVERWNSVKETNRWQNVQRWSNHDLFERNDQRIRTIRMTSNYVSWTVESTKTNEWRVDLLDYNLNIIRQGIKIDHLNKFSSCLLSNYGREQFLIIDSNCHLLYLLDSNGNTKLKNDPLLTKRINNAVLMTNQNQKWLVVRLELPDQLYFIPLIKKTAKN